ncbi:ComEA family DNA-binding protein [Ascidiimonas sp. W6]|uniref:ComEA family DNA-binding protein n=1 Tax=Ascidiimonas meishanensis TaxID=3128903 RepID=UPI0030EEBAC4
MNKKSRFVFLRKERNGIFYLLILLCFIFMLVFLQRQYLNSKPAYNYHDVSLFLDKAENKQKGKQNKSKWKFNPNYISDYFGYSLGMQTIEIDALHAFRKKKKYIKSVKHFQEITGISDSLLELIAPRFSFPKYQKNKSRNLLSKFESAKMDVKHDLNKADSVAFTKVYGIGPVLAGRIVKYRSFLGGFNEDEQLKEVYGLKPEIIENVLERFTVQSTPNIVQRDINSIALKELTKIPYISSDVARKIIIYRSKVGSIDEMNELTKIQDFPSEKINIIKVYLTIK